MQNIRTGNGVPNRRILYQGINHDLPNTNVKRADLHAIMRAWFTEHGVLAFAGNTAPTLVEAASVTAANGRVSAPFSVTLKRKMENLDCRESFETQQFPSLRNGIFR